MLSGESAVGEHPVDAVETMREICVQAEAYLKSAGRRAREGLSQLSEFVGPVTAAAVDAGCLMAEQLDAALIMVTAESGRTALALSNRRPAATILALARGEDVARRLGLCWGVTAVVLRDDLPSERALFRGIDWAKSHGLVQPGQHAVLLHDRVADRSDVRAVLAGAVA
jgi:pyruvate kinase